MYEYSGVPCARFSKTFWRNVLFTAIITLFEAAAESVQLKSTCNPSSDPVPIIHPYNPTEKDDSPESVFSANNSIELSWSKLVYRKCKLHVEFVCNASYPIEWVEHFDQDIESLTDATFNITKHIWVDRVLNETQLETTNPFSLNSISDFTNYTTLLGVNYKEMSLCAAANYTCQSVNNPCLQSTVISVVDRENEIIKYEYKEGPPAPDNDNNSRPQNTTCEAYIDVMKFENGREGWRCKSLQDVFVKAGTCDAAVHCNSLFNHFKQGCVRVKKIKNGDPCDGCMFRNRLSKRYFFPGHYWCENEHGKILTTVHYFLSILQSIGPDIQELPELYLHWDEANPQKMLYLEQVPKEIFLGERKEIACKVSRYYFSYGHRFGFEYQNGTMLYTKHLDGKSGGIENVNRMSLNFTFTEQTLKRIYCFAPVWNSTVWINQSIEIHLRNDGVAPLFLGPLKNKAHATFQLHQKNATLTCEASGLPRPEINWKLDNAGIVYIETTEIEVEEGSRKDLNFQYVTDSTSGRYICEATNYLGTATKVFIVSVKDEHADFVRTTSIMATIVTLTFIVTLALCWMKVRRQKNQIRALTEAEVAEFREGNLDILENTEYLDTQELLQALPYNDSYEISCKCLYVDPTEILGSGNFGQVLKGVIYDRHDRRKSKVVAVKTSKPKSDFAFFQTLLTEVKIMAYIGHHPNVVNFVGACTENIRNRQIFIAVEFCGKGSLNNFLKNNRSSFVNLICEDTIYATTSFCDHDEQEHIYQNSETPLEISTVHLLKWSREIANGMEFLGSKKIVHGDLAARNILLSDDLVAKIGDFGLSRVLMTYSNYVRSTQDDCHLPWAWLAPETLQELKFSVMSDVWSYGVTLWEVFSLAQQPYLGTIYNSAFLTFLNAGHRLHKPNYATSQIYNSIMECWCLEPSRRATFADLKDLFEGLLVQACNGDYVHTKVNGNNGAVMPYISRSHALVQNPGYAVLGGQDLSLEDEHESDSDTRTLSTTVQVVTPAENTQGYLKPLVFDYEKIV